MFIVKKIKSAKGHPMTYIKLLTVLAGLALLTACGGGTPADKAGGDTTTDCKTNAFHADCDAVESAISSRRNMCLSDSTTDDSCDEVIVGACEANPFRAETACGHTDYDDDRETACQMFGTNTDMGGDDSCATSLASSCTITDPFAYTGCNNVEGIAGVRMMYCQTPATAWDEECMDGTHGTVVSFRTIACLESPFGTPANPLCVTDSFTETTCEMNPFASANPGCANLTDYKNIVKTYCVNNPMEAPCVVNAADWVASFNTEPATTPTTGTLKNEFLQATGGTLPTGALTNSDGSAITVVPKLTLNANDGVAFFQGYSGNSATEYAGIFDTTDLGAPFTEDAPSAKWKGQFQAVGFPVETDFLLEVTFGMDVNVPGSVGSIDAFVSAGSNFYYLIEGTFNGTGVIKGTASSGLFAGNDRTTPMGNLEGGVLTGLIGAEGAVGAFYTNAMLTAGASGGFVAKPTAPDTEPLVVNHGDWLRDFFKAPPARLDDTNPRRQFLAGGPAGLDTTGTVQEPIPNDGNILLTLDSARYNGEPLGGSRDASDGVAAFFDDGETAGDATGVYYAGLLSGTDLGAPLTQASGSVKWYGQISTIFSGFKNVNKKDFVLEITFGEKAGVDGSAGSIEGFVQQGTSSSTNYYQLTGTYDAGGVITGEVIFGIFTGSIAEGNLATTVTPNGILTGLIGEQGAVGAFIAGAGAKEAIVGSTGYVGGFVAAPPPSPYAKFKTYYSARTDGRRLHATTAVSTIFAAFVEGTATSLPTDGLTFTGGTGRFAPFTVRLGEAGSGDDGFAIMYGVTAVGNNNRYRAGLLSGTDLGPALDNTISTAWTGTIYTSLNLASGVPASIPLDLTVDFTAGTIEADAVTVATGLMVDINGEFGSAHSLPDGILGGTVTHLGVSVPLIGLIGTEGVLGIFHGDGLTIVGGFQASPN